MKDLTEKTLTIILSVINEKADEEYKKQKSSSRPDFRPLQALMNAKKELVVKACDNGLSKETAIEQLSRDDKYPEVE